MDATNRYIELWNVEVLKDFRLTLQAVLAPLSLN